MAEALHAWLIQCETAAVARASTSNPQTYELDLRAGYAPRQFSNSGDLIYLKLAEAYSRQTLAEDLDFALAHAKLSGDTPRVPVSLTTFSAGPGGRRHPKMKPHANGPQPCCQAQLDRVSCRWR